MNTTSLKYNFSAIRSMKLGDIKWIRMSIVPLLFSRMDRVSQNTRNLLCWVTITNRVTDRVSVVSHV